MMIILKSECKLFNNVTASHSFLFRFGRKMSFLVSNLLNGIAGILVAVAPNYVALLILRTFYGFGVKGGWVAGYVLSKNFLFHTETIHVRIEFQILQSHSEF